jgi:GrpB-like predicted nucleotidyltransferase (UPF0157 family)
MLDLSRFRIADSGTRTVFVTEVFDSKREQAERSHANDIALKPCHRMTQHSLQQAIHERVEIVAYDPAWPARFEVERSRLMQLFNELIEVEHIGSTAVPGLPAKPVIDLMAAVPSLQVADRLIPRLCQHGYVTSAEFNATLRDRRWLMRHSGGRRTHHLHLVLPESDAWNETIRFRDLLRGDRKLASEYGAFKNSLVASLANDREAYTTAKGEFIRRVLNANARRDTANGNSR